MCSFLILQKKLQKNSEHLQLRSIHSHCRSKNRPSLKGIQVQKENIWQTVNDHTRNLLVEMRKEIKVHMENIKVGLEKESQISYNSHPIDAHGDMGHLL